MKQAQKTGVEKMSDYDTPIDCILTFLTLFIPMILLSVLIRYYNKVLFFSLLFFSGWFTSTFLEYMAHRYLLHPENKKKRFTNFNHQYNKTHPGKRKFSSPWMLLMIFGCFALILFAIRWNNYFTLLAGLLFGLPWYTFKHYLIHQKIGYELMPKSVRNHIYYHEYPDKCFGTSVTWWDDILDTNSSNSKIICPRIIDSFYKKEKGKGADFRKEIATKKTLKKASIKKEFERRIVIHEDFRVGAINTYTSAINTFI